jgi:hypothetical protein
MTFIVRTLTSALLLAAATSGASALEGPGRALAASNVLKLSADTTRSGLLASKEFVVPYAGVVRVKLQYRSDGNGPQNVSLAVNSTIHNCSDSTTQTNFKAYSCDLKVVAGDRVRVTAMGFMTVYPDPPAQSAAYLRNVRLYWTIINSAGTGGVLLD